MITTVGQDKITLKRDLKDIFPKEFANRLLINEFITYILNNFFEKSNEKIVNGYVGELTNNPDGTNCYIKEPTMEKNINQIIPVLNDGEEYIIYDNFISDIYNEGCKIYDENKLFSSKYWSWCPPVNVDMFTNSYNYYWIGWDYKEKSMKIIIDEIDVSSIINKTYISKEEIEKLPFKGGDRVVFVNDTSDVYNNIPYDVDEIEYEERDKESNEIKTKTDFLLTPAIMPLVVLNGETNIDLDINGNSSYTYKDKKLEFELRNGMRIMFLNDINIEYNKIPYMVTGVGSSIKLIDDSYDPYYYLDDEEKYYNTVLKPEYFVMERGCVDGNDWSTMNRWVHIKSLDLFNTASLSSFGKKHGLYHASMPILCYNKDIELYNYGTFSRGVIVAKTDVDINYVNGKSVYDSDIEKLFKNIPYVKGGTVLKSGDVILFTNVAGENPIHLYTVNIYKEKIILKACKNGQEIDGKLSDGSSIKGDVVKLINVKNNKTYYETYFYNGYEWIKGQKKTNMNQNPLFNLYDSDKISLNNNVSYPSSTFTGNKLFDYKESNYDGGIYSGDIESNGEIISYGLDRYYEIIGKDSKNYAFDNHLHTDEYFYTPDGKYTTKIKGYKFFKINGKDEYLNDWHLSKSNDNQYIKTRIEINNNSLFTTIDNELYYKIVLKYKPSESSTKASLIIYNNGNYFNTENIKIADDSVNVKKNDYTIYVKNVSMGDILDISILTNNNIDNLNSNYIYEMPPSFIRNQFNEEITMIAYNNCFDQMVDIMENQEGFIGNSNGVNNYYLLNPNLSVGSKIIQTTSNIIRTMILNNNPNTSIRASIEYEENAYNKFKIKFMNVLNQYYINGLIVDDNKSMYEMNPESMDTIITEIINKINIDKNGLMPFYNNGVIYLIENAYIPSTPAYLGAANSYEPKIITFNEYIGNDEKPKVIVGHDGSLTLVEGNVKDLFIKRLEDLIYNSINTKFKDTRCGINKFKFLPGFFRKNTYTRNELLNTYSTFFDNWSNKNNLNYTEHVYFIYDEDIEDSWKTWNYTGCYNENGEELHGSYKSVYMYYYDTYRPDTHPWEMLGFGDKPSWWEKYYGSAPYTSFNEIMWRDIESGIIKDGTLKGEYEELKRPELFEKYLPVDENGKLKSPMDINIISSKPTIQKARAKWNIGDIGEIESAFMQTSEYRYAEQIVLYLLRPLEWVETNWNTLSSEKLFNGTDYEQTVNVNTGDRENIRNTILHNELIYGKYIRNIGIQQWISDYALSNSLNITDIANKIRNSEINLGYRCSGFFQKDTLEITTDEFGVIPEENVHTSLFKSKNKLSLTYSGMIIQKTNKGYTIDGFDKSFPYFYVRKPETNGKKSTFTSEGLDVFYYLNWKDDVEKVPYKKEFTSIQDVYNIINGYGKYLEDNEKWYFNTRNSSGVIMNWRTSSESFVTWATAQKGENTDGNVLLLNPGVIGVGNYNYGMVEDLNLKNCGYYTVLDIYGNSVDASEMNVFRQTFNTYFQPKDANIAFVKFRTYNLEHLIVLDNKTIYGDVLYDYKYNSLLPRFNLSCVKVKNWYGTIYAPGYLLTDDGAISNYDKSANDLQYMFDVDDPRCQGKYDDYSRSIVGFNRTKTYMNLLKNDKAMFDFYKGSIREKGTHAVLDRINRSSYVSSTGNNIDIYESWLFKAGEFGHTKDNSVLEFILDMTKMRNNPQIITFETANNYYYNQNKVYKKGELVIYNGYEYYCLEDGTTGYFDKTKWGMIRFIGNYIIFGDDSKWIKKQKNNNLNGFVYTNDLMINPIGGFAQLNDVTYIVANEEEFNELINEKTVNSKGEEVDKVSIGETIWIVKLNNEDWDIRKKTGINKFVSMRYTTVADARNKQDVDYVYHFKDDMKDYYTTRDENTITNDTQLYSDIDLNNPTYKWGDIGKPVYDNYIGKYISGTDYKVKLFNSVFITMTPENELNKNTIFRDLENDTEGLTYSNLSLKMVQYGRRFHEYKWKFELHIDTKAPNLEIYINGTKYEDRKDISIVVTEDQIIDYSISAYCCDKITGKIYIPKVMEYEIDESSTVPTNPKDEYQFKYTGSTCIIDSFEFENNVYYAYKTNFGWIKLGTDPTDRQLKLTYTLKYSDGKELFNSNNPLEKSELLLLYKGQYKVELVGAGGGAGGGLVKKPKKKKKKFIKHIVSAAIATVAVAASVFTAGASLAIGAAALAAAGTTAAVAATASGVVTASTGALLTKIVRNRTNNNDYGGCCGGSGAYINCLLDINSDSLITGDTLKYYIANGTGGTGGSYSSDGLDGSDTFIMMNDKNLLTAKAGHGGAKAFNGYKYSKEDNTESFGIGGICTYDETSSFIKLIGEKIGESGNSASQGSFEGNVGVSAYSGKTYGQGGIFNYASAGDSGENGYIRVIYTDPESYEEKIPPMFEKAKIISISVDGSDSLEYSAYYQPYVIQFDDDKIVYFYSYGVLNKDEIRPDAQTLSSGTKFYRNRSKSITAYHKPYIAKDVWVNENSKNKSFNVGDTTSVRYIDASINAYIVPGSVQYSRNWLSKTDGGTALVPVEDIIYYVASENKYYRWNILLSKYIEIDVDDGFIYYRCVYPYVAGIEGLFTKTITIDGEEIIVWEEYSPTYYYKINYNYGSGCTDPYQTVDGKLYNTELYYDAECTQCIDVTVDGYEKILTVKDLAIFDTSEFDDTDDEFSNRTHVVGVDYTLVDEFASYYHLTPRYLDEPSWGLINQNNNYEITSGGIQYYVELDEKHVIEEIEKGNVVYLYTDENCKTNAMRIDSKTVDIADTDENKIEYRAIPLEYKDIINVKSNHYEPSYRLKDNDIILFANMKECNNDTPVFKDEGLTEEAGIYSDYIPVWEKISYVKNPYHNTINYIKYDENDNDFNIFNYNSGIKSYKLTTYADENKTTEISLYYKLDDSTTYYKFTPSTANENGKVETSGYNLYVKNDDEYSSYIGDVYVNMEENTSIFYVSEKYNDSLINEESTNKSNVKMFFNEQLVGRYIDSDNIIFNTNFSDDLYIMFDRNYDPYDIITKDPMYELLYETDNEISIVGITKEGQIIKIKEKYKEFINNGYYFDYDEIIGIYEKYKNEITGKYSPETHVHYFDDSSFIKHKCEIYDMYRNEKDENNNLHKEYHRLYKFGEDFYESRNVSITEVENVPVGVKFGTIDDFTIYHKDIITNEYSNQKTYSVNDWCKYKGGVYICKVPVTEPEDFDVNKWELFTNYKILNVIQYKEPGDYIYITNDGYGSSNSINVYDLYDAYDIAKENNVFGNIYNDDLKFKKGWMKIEYIDKDYQFNLLEAQRLRIATNNIKSCYLVDNYDDSTIIKVQVFDPIQNVIPSNVLSEVNYISSTDPVIDYNDIGKWNDNKIGYLWWDTSKVRYVDYYQGDYDYRRQNWGKQLPGSEIVINEWTRSSVAPDDGRKYVTRTLYDYEIDSVVTYYYYWEKNPVEVPNVSFRKNSALVIASVINNPTEEGIIWMSPIETNISDDNYENTLILCNYNNVINGQEAVLQINMDSDKDVLDHTEWVRVLENTEKGEIPEFLWSKMKESLLGYKVSDDGEQLPVPSKDLTGKQRLGLSYRPMQTMFDNIYNARENFIDIINDIFASRDYDHLGIDMNSWLIKEDIKNQVVDKPSNYEENYIANSKLELMSWKDEDLIGKRILVNNDETHDGIWTIYEIGRNNDWTYTLVDYQKYNINKYLTLLDWYENYDVKCINPTYVVGTSSADAMELCRTLPENSIVKYVEGNDWELYQLVNNNGLYEVKLVGESSIIIHISDKIYDYVNDSSISKSTDPYFIELKDGTKLTEYEYVYNETQYLLEKLIEYFGTKN